MTRLPVGEAQQRWKTACSLSKAALLGSKNPFSKKATPKENIVWLLDNTAYQPIKPDRDAPQPWEAEFVACFFHKGRKDISKNFSAIADLIGLDGKLGSNDAARKRIEERLTPFLMAITPARTVNIKVPCPNPSGTPHRLLLGPSDVNGISSQNLLTGGGEDADGKTVICTSEDNTFPDLRCKTRFVGPEGWGVISDIDDTVKVTMTTAPVGILQSTFADVPKTTSGMPDFYKVLDESLGKPAWFYLSASPYNLYPFLDAFLKEYYPAGTMILRDASWMSFAGLLQSLTVAIQAYKTDRIEKIHKWLPQRRFICIGDSTQSDPEAYAEMYSKHPEWIKAIYIRKVTDAPHMEMKNTPRRFRDAFKDVPDNVWRLFVDPKELADHVQNVSGAAHAGMLGSMLSV